MQKPPTESWWRRLTPDQRLDIVGWVLVILAALTLLSIFSAEQGALTGWWLGALSYFFGWGMYVVPFFLGGLGLWLILRHFGERIPSLDPEQVVGVVMGFFVLLATMHLVLSYVWPEVDLYKLGEDGLGGGILGALMFDFMVKGLGPAGTIITLLMAWLVVLTFTLGISPADAVRMVLQKPLQDEYPDPIQPVQIPLPETMMSPTGLPDPPITSSAGRVVLGGENTTAAAPKKPGGRKPSRKKDDTPPPPEIRSAARSNGATEIQIPPVGSQVWRLPEVDQILEQGSEQYFSEDLIRKHSRIIEETLVSLGAPVRVQEINNGPVVTQFGIEPLFITARSGKTTKVKVSKIAGLADDLALALSARSIRIQAPIPGKGLVGVEVPNDAPAVVSLMDVMQSPQFSKGKGRLRLGLGQDVSGQAAAADLRSMPHLLIAGATGSGKSVCVNSIVAAMLLQNSPDTLRMLMVDPKRVELTQYNGIPHLLAPVIVDVDRVVPALRWVMREMDSRYRRFAEIGARNIEDFNRRAQKTEEESSIPYIAVLIDELADLMLQVPEETERVICRLAQMARATGIHLIVATQRPSVDVVTGLIKANFPSRIAFAVASSVDSRVILDTPGAERLLGRGDMLFMPPDVSQPLRLQGAFVSDRELDRLIAYWRAAVEPEYAPEHVNMSKSGGENASATAQSIVANQPALFPDFEEEAQAAAQFEDALLPTAVEIFLAENRASISLLQRRLRIGYTRSARLVDMLMDMGVVMVEKQGQFRKINRPVAEALLVSIHGEGEEQ